VPKDEELDDGWDVDFECTVLGYMKMGMPNQILIYKNESDYKSGAEPLAVKDFSAKTDGDRQTTIELGNLASADWINGSLSYAYYNGEGGAFSGFHSECVKLTVIDNDTLLYQEYYYPNPDHPDFPHGVDYQFERQYYYDPVNDCVFILRTETGNFEGNVYIGTHDKGYLSSVRIERHPEKDRLTGHPAVRFILNPKEITGNEKGEYSNNLRFNRDKTSD